MPDDQRPGAGNSNPTRLQAAYERARALKSQNQKSEPYVLKNIKRHKHVPVLAPKGPMRIGPDRAAFQYYEALDRAEALQHRKSHERQRQFGKAASNREPGFER